MNAIEQIAKGMRLQQPRETRTGTTGQSVRHVDHAEVAYRVGYVPRPNLMLWTGWTHLPIMDIKEERCD